MMKLGVLYGGKFHTSELRRVVKECEAWGYQYYWHSDERFFRDCYAGLTACAMETERIQLGVAVTDPYSRHPALTAMGITTVDEISNGRAILGIGSGVSGMVEMGIQPKRPSRAMRESIELIRQLLRNEPVTYHGEMIHFENGVLRVPARPDLLIYIAAKGPLNIQLAGEIADGLIISSCVADATIDHTLALLAKGAQKAGRDPAAVQLASRVNISISDDGDAARQAVKPMLGLLLISKRPDFSFLDELGLKMSSKLEELTLTLPYSHDPEVLGAMADAIPDEFVEALAVAGTPQEVAPQIARMARRGVGQFMAYPHPNPGNTQEDVLRRLALEVMPMVESAAVV